MRFTIRTLMIGVAILALLLGALIALARMSDLARTYEATAKYMATVELYERDVAALCDRKSDELREQGKHELADQRADEATAARRDAAEFHRMTEIYERAASRPWESLPPGTNRAFLIQPPRTTVELLAGALARQSLPILIGALGFVMSLALVVVRARARRRVCGSPTNPSES
jgi:hypothetical protein